MSMVQAVCGVLQCNHLQVRSLAEQQSAEQLTKLISRASCLGQGSACQAKPGNNHAPAAHIWVMFQVESHLLSAHSDKDLVLVICTISRSHQQVHIPDFPNQNFEAQNPLPSTERLFGLVFAPSPQRRSWRQDISKVLSLTLAITKSLHYPFKLSVGHPFPIAFPFCAFPRHGSGEQYVPHYISTLIYLVTQAEPAACVR